MKVFYTFFLFVVVIGSRCCCQLYERSGPFGVGERDFVFSDPTLPLGNQRISGKVFFPVDSIAPDQIANDSFPIIAFGHGFNIGYLSYRNIYRHLASWGYILIAPDVQNGINVNHRIFAQQLAACIKYLKREGSSVGSFYFQKVASTSACMGHSMGGGSSFLVPSIYDSVTALVGLAPAETNPSAIESLRKNSVPLLIISGSADNTTPENQHQAPMYNASNSPKLWISLRGGAHCKFTDGPTICDLVSSPGTLNRERQLALTRKYIVPFFNYYLKSMQQARTFICGDSILADSAASYLQFFTDISCAPPTALLVTQFSEQSIFCYPTFVSDALEVQAYESGLFQIWDGGGRQIIKSVLLAGNHYSFTLPNVQGVLVWNFETRRKILQGKFFKTN